MVCRHRSGPGMIWQYGTFTTVALLQVFIVYSYDVIVNDCVTIILWYSTQNNNNNNNNVCLTFRADRIAIVFRPLSPQVRHSTDLPEVGLRIGIYLYRYLYIYRVSNCYHLLFSRSDTVKTRNSLRNRICITHIINKYYKKKILKITYIIYVNIWLIRAVCRLSNGRHVTYYHRMSVSYNRKLTYTIPRRKLRVRPFKLNI